MKILQVNAVYGIKSTGRTCAELTDAIKAHSGESLTACSTQTALADAVCIAPMWECKFHALASRVTGLQGYFSPVSTANLIKLIHSYEPDVVHLRNLHSNYLNLNVLFRFLASKDIPTVVTLHDCWPYTGKCTHYTAVGCNKWQTGCHACPKLKCDNKSWFFDRTAKMWHDKEAGWQSIPRLAVVGVSDWITQEAERSPMFAHAKIIRRIYNWIDLDVFAPCDTQKAKEKLGFAGKKIILGVASSWSERKGLDKFFALADSLDRDEKIVFVGRMPHQALPENVLSVLETTDVKELAAYYNAADVFLQLSEEETFGKVTAEALACGTPVITNNKTANPELVDATCGITLAATDCISVAEALKTVLQNGKEHYTQTCTARARRLFEKDANIRLYENLYAELAGRCMD